MLSSKGAGYIVTQLSRVTLIAIGYVTSLCFLCPRVVCLT
jgi:hypothetical protein